MYENELQHWGIKGMKWGVRRYQNKDGTLTAAGRKRLGLDVYDTDHNSDIVLKKGTKASRVVSTSRYQEYTDPDMGGNLAAGKKYINDKLSEEKKLESKYLSVDNVRNSGRKNGKEFYMHWFTDGGWSPDSAVLTMYELKNNVKIASGKKVIDALLEEVGPVKVNELLKNNSNVRSLTLNYTRDKDLFNRVNKRFADEGYDAIEDINDTSTDMPIIVFNSSKILGDPVSIQTGREAIDDIINNKRSF